MKHPIRSLVTRAAAVALLAAAPFAAHAQAAAPSTWTIDPAKSTLEFLFEQAGAKNTGRFTRFTGNIDFNPANLATAKVDVTVDLASVDTRDPDRDGSLKGDEYFNVAKFATAKYSATQFTAKGTSFEAAGSMTFHGVTKKAPATFTYSTATEAGQTVAWLKGTFPFKRTDFGVGGADAESLKWMPPDITVNFNLRLVPRAGTPASVAAPAPNAGAPAKAPVPAKKP